MLEVCRANPCLNGSPSTISKDLISVSTLWVSGRITNYARVSGTLVQCCVCEANCAVIVLVLLSLLIPNKKRKQEEETRRIKKLKGLSSLYISTKKHFHEEIISWPQLEIDLSFRDFCLICLLEQ